MWIDPMMTFFSSAEETTLTLFIAEQVLRVKIWRLLWREGEGLYQLLGREVDYVEDVLANKGQQQRGLSFDDVYVVF